MNLELQNACKTIRGLGSSEAAEWLISNFSFDTGNAGEAFLIMPHRSWAKPEQVKLADYYLRNLPHRSDRGYRALLKFMGLSTFIDAMNRRLPDDREERGLIEYHLRPLLKSHPDRPKYQSMVDDFLASLS